MEFLKIRHILSCARKAVEQYHMIDDGDRICVGLSGGKDSMALLAVLMNLRIFFPKKFTLCAATISMGFKGMDYSPIAEFCADSDIEYRLVETELAHVIFDIRKENNPCSLCAKMRRGMLHDSAVSMGCNKIALGHHSDDVIDTFMLNLFREGRLSSFLPVTYLTRKNITMIRPLIYASEDSISDFIQANSLPLVKNLCPEDGQTEREHAKQVLNEMEKKDPGVKTRIFHAIENGGIFDKSE